MKCGSCTKSHAKVVDVKNCYGLAAARKALPQKTERFVTVDNGFGGTTTIKASVAKARFKGYIGTYEGSCPDVERCSRCAGTGQFITGMENGVPTGPGGVCYRCAGKARWSDCGEALHGDRALLIATGEQDDLTACCDRVRNDLYDRFGIRIYL